MKFLKTAKEKISKVLETPYLCTVAFPAIATTYLLTKTFVAGDTSYESVPIADIATAGLGALTDAGRYFNSHKYKPKY